MKNKRNFFSTAFIPRSCALFLLLGMFFLVSCKNGETILLEDKKYNAWPHVNEQLMLDELSDDYKVSMSEKKYDPNSDSLEVVTSFVLNPIDTAGTEFYNVNIHIYRYPNYKLANTAFQKKYTELKLLSEKEYDKNAPFHPGANAYPNYYIISDNYIYLVSGTYNVGSEIIDEVFQSIIQIISKGQTPEDKTIVKLKYSGEIEID